VFVPSRPMVTSDAAVSTTERLLSLILLNQIFMEQWGVISG
jgi:hypothetical protein